MFHSMVRGSSPAWYSRTSLYSSPAPRTLERSSPPGWNPRRRSTGQRDRRSNWSTAKPPATTSGGKPVSQVDTRWRESIEHTLDDRLGVDTGRDPFVSEDETVPDDFGRHLAQVVREDIRTTTHEGERPAGSDQVDRGARAGAVGDGGREVLEAFDLPWTARVGERRGIGPNRGIDIHLSDRPLHVLELVEGDHLAELDRRAGDALDDHDLFLEGRVID